MCGAPRPLMNRYQSPSRHRSRCRSRRVPLSPCLSVCVSVCVSRPMPESRHVEHGPTQTLQTASTAASCTLACHHRQGSLLLCCTLVSSEAPGASRVRDDVRRSVHFPELCALLPLPWRLAVGEGPLLCALNPVRSSWRPVRCVLSPARSFGGHARRLTSLRRWVTEPRTSVPMIRMIEIAPDA